MASCRAGCQINNLHHEGENMQRSLWLRRLAVLMVFGLLAAACGGDEETEDTGATETDTEMTETETETETAAETETDGETTAGASVDGTLQIGTILPQTGDLAVLGPAMVEAVKLAVEQVNEAGGVLIDGELTEVELQIGDSGTNEQVASNTLDQLLNDGIDAFVGAASSRISLSIIDKATGADVVMCSPSNTGSALTTAEDETPGFYFRTAPPDNLQGPALANVITGDGYSDVAIIALNDEYGQGFANELESAISDAGGNVVANVAYDPAGTEFSADVQQALEADPQAIALISFPDTGSKIIRELLSAGIEPDQIYTADGMQGEQVAELVNPDDASAIDGMKGTAPSSQGSEQFSQAFQEFAPEGTPQIFSAHAYDCAILIALASSIAGTDDPAQFNTEIVQATKEGEKCDSYSACLELIQGGTTDIDYDGATGTLDFIDVGEPASGTYEIWQFDSSAEGGITTLDTTTIEGEGGGDS
ncbi:MAG: ABC transporter substrate-binding protein [Nitriliruptorales bacterium]|nr:ABC transporter substrate-binding protein [Nitriliruptorales bacterium]